MMNKMIKRSAIVAMAAIMAVLPTAEAMAASTLTEVCVDTANHLKKMNEKETQEFLEKMQEEIQTLPVEEQIVIVKGIPTLVKVMNGEEDMQTFCDELEEALFKVQNDAEDTVVEGNDTEEAETEEDTAENAWADFEDTVKGIVNLTEPEITKAVDETVVFVENSDIPDEMKELIKTAVDNMVADYDEYMNPAVVEPVSYKAYCTAGFLNVRPTPEPSGDPIACLKKDESVNVIGKVTKGGNDTDWVEVTINGKIGYVNAQYLTKTAPKKDIKKKDKKKKKKKENKVKSTFTLVKENGNDIKLYKYTDGKVKTASGDECKKIEDGKWKNKKTGAIYLSRTKWKKKHEKSKVGGKGGIAPIYNKEYDFKLYGGKDADKKYIMHKLPDGSVINDKYQDLVKVKGYKGIWQNKKTKEYFSEKKGDENLIELKKEQKKEEKAKIKKENSKKNKKNNIKKDTNKKQKKQNNKKNSNKKNTNNKKNNKKSGKKK